MRTIRIFSLQARLFGQNGALSCLRRTIVTPGGAPETHPRPRVWGAHVSAQARPSTGSDEVMEGASDEAVWCSVRREGPVIFAPRPSPTAAMAARDSSTRGCT